MLFCIRFSLIWTLSWGAWTSAPASKSHWICNYIFIFIFILHILNLALLWHAKTKNRDIIACSSIGYITSSMSLCTSFAICIHVKKDNCIICSSNKHCSASNCKLIFGHIRLECFHNPYFGITLSNIVAR